MSIKWTDDNVGMLARATAIYRLNLEAGFPGPDAITMTAICLAESHGFDTLGPIHFHPTDGRHPYVGNTNGTVDVSPWQINKAVPRMPLAYYARAAYELYKRRKFQPWHAYTDRESNVNWPLFVEIAEAAAKAWELPKSWADAQSFRANQ